MTDTSLSFSRECRALMTLTIRTGTVPYGEDEGLRRTTNVKMAATRNEKK